MRVAALYRRWATKSALVACAVGQLLARPVERDRLPSTGSMRGDLVEAVQLAGVDGRRRDAMIGTVCAAAERQPLLSAVLHSADAGPRVEAYPGAAGSRDHHGEYSGSGTDPGCCR